MSNRNYLGNKGYFKNSRNDVILGVIDGYHSTKLETFRVKKPMYRELKPLKLKPVSSLL